MASKCECGHIKGYHKDFAGDCESVDYVNDTPFRCLCGKFTPAAPPEPVGEKCEMDRPYTTNGVDGIFRCKKCGLKRYEDFSERDCPGDKPAPPTPEPYELTATAAHRLGYQKGKSDAALDLDRFIAAVGAKLIERHSWYDFEAVEAVRAVKAEFEKEGK